MISLFACRTSKEVKNDKPKIVYRVFKIDSIENVYLIYGRNADTIYKILSVKEKAIERSCTIIVSRSYAFRLKSLFLKKFNGKYDITPEAIDLLNGVSFYGTSITIDNTFVNERRDLFISENLKGLCFIK